MIYLYINWYVVKIQQNLRQRHPVITILYRKILTIFENNNNLIYDLK